MKRKGTVLKDLGDGHPRRMADAKNAFRKMDFEQRMRFLAWMQEEFSLPFGPDFVKLVEFADREGD